jgi:hypothetical protein
LGEGKAQIDAMVSLVIGLLLIGVPGPRNIIVGIMPWMAVGVAVILVFLILYGFVAGDLSGIGKGEGRKWVLPAFAVVVGIFVIIVVLQISGLWDNFLGWFSGADSSDIWMNVVMIVLVIVAMAVAVMGGKNKKDD